MRSHMRRSSMGAAAAAPAPIASGAMSKRRQKVEKIQRRLEKINLDSPGLGSAATSVSHKTPEMTPHFRNQWNIGSPSFQGYQSANTSILSPPFKRAKRAEQPPPSTPVLEVDEGYLASQGRVGNVGNLLTMRTCSQAHLYDDDNRSVPDIIFERRELEEDESDHLESFLQQRQRSSSLGDLTSQQTKNYLDDFLLKNQSLPISKYSSQMLRTSE